MKMFKLAFETIGLFVVLSKFSLKVRLFRIVKCGNSGFYVHIPYNGIASNIIG